MTNEQYAELWKQVAPKLKPAIREIFEQISDKDETKGQVAVQVGIVAAAEMLNFKLIRMLADLVDPPPVPTAPHFDPRLHPDTHGPY